MTASKVAIVGAVVGTLTLGGAAYAGLVVPAILNQVSVLVKDGLRRHEDLSHGVTEAQINRIYTHLTRIEAKVDRLLEDQ